MIDVDKRRAPVHTVEHLRAIFLRPDVPLPLPADDCVPQPSISSAQMEIAIAEHVCPCDESHWVELWAVPCDRGHIADQWHTKWCVTDDFQEDPCLDYIDYCPFCGLDLEAQIDRNGYYKYIGEPVEDYW